jgi:hypothetical protein
MVETLEQRVIAWLTSEGLDVGGAPLARGTSLLAFVRKIRDEALAEAYKEPLTKVDQEGEASSECENCGMFDVPLIKDDCCIGCICQRCGKSAFEAGRSMNDMGWCEACEVLLALPEGTYESGLANGTIPPVHKPSTFERIAWEGLDNWDGVKRVLDEGDARTAQLETLSARLLPIAQACESALQQAQVIYRSTDDIKMLDAADIAAMRCLREQVVQLSAQGQLSAQVQRPTQG